MKQVTLALFVALMVFTLVPTGTFAAAQPGQAAPAPEVGADTAGQAGQGEAQTPGKPGCGLWEFIKKYFVKDPAQEAEALKKLLILADKDLELCLNTLGGKEKNYLKVFPAVGHLNHALAAINKGHPPKYLKPCFKELVKRISHAKFYLVAYDFSEAEARVKAAKDYIGDIN